MDATYNQFSSGVVKSEYRSVMPVSELNFNTPNNYTVFKLDHGDTFYDSGIQFHICGKVVKKSDGAAYSDKTNIKLIDNFVPFLFTRIELKKHNTTIDTVDYPGVTSTVKGILNYSSSNKNSLGNCGFVSTFTGGGNFEVIGTLAHLGLGFFDHLRYPMYKGGFEVVFTRAEDNDALFVWKGSAATDTIPEDGKVEIKSFVLRVPLVEYTATSKIQLIDGLTRLSDHSKLVYNYYQWQCIEKKGVFGASFNFDITNVYRNVYNPKFVIVGLQTSRWNDQKKIPSRFDSCNIKNVAVKINGERYPQEMQNIHITEGKWRLLYEQLVRYRLVNFGDTNVFVSPSEFKNDYPLLVIDTHLHPMSTDRSRSDIQIELDFVNAIATAQADAGTTAYVVVVSETGFSYDISRNIIRQL
ncbi:uncharacterized protein LOC128984275 [Macrosteles quadrilineatus]|uniref:uncharacterized protein LOC128984275 n=1 Tax=Macrosteles quadrilineatus TaxID=74068 RepID=UPI0023E1EDDA|nr:uncharacterized protein LOC128984275 [Macrosteles quadrilineatus]